MKIVLTLVGLLLIGSGLYLWSYVEVLPNDVSKNTVIDTDVPSDSMCTSTACMSDTAVVENSDSSQVDVTYKKYIDFVSPNGFINSEPFTLAEFIGKKVILLEFITYGCINCQRTFPYMQSWHEKYEKDGLLVVGIHTPEFAFEKVQDNVVAAMKKEGITFPIVMDNEFKTWNAYSNRFWPHRYVIDYNGNIVFDHIGEGAYSETEKTIQSLLKNKPAGV